MGKETISSRLFTFGESLLPSVIPQRATYKKLANTWCTEKEATLKEDVHEDGHIIVQLLFPLTNMTINCRGFQPEGNRNIELLANLRHNGIIRLNERIEGIFVYRDFTWDSLDLIAGTFNSGDTIIVRIAVNEQRREKTLNKPALSVKKRLRKPLKNKGAKL